MKMNKKVNLYLVLALFLALFTACKAAIGTPMLGNKPKVLKPGEVPIQVRLGHLDKNGKPVEGFPSYRAVVPEDWGDVEKEKLAYKVEGTDPDSNSITSVWLEWDEIKTGTASIVLSKKGNYTLTMTAYEKVNPIDNSSNIVLKSLATTINIDTAPVAAFVLYAARTEVSAPDGNLNLKIKFSNPKKYGPNNDEAVIKALKVKIKPKTTGTAESTDILTSFTDVTPSTQAGEQFVEVTKTLKPALYYITIEAFKDIGTTERIGGVFKELIIIDPLRTTEGVIELPTNLQETPIAPANFKVKYEIESQTDYGKKPDSGVTTYSATFSWDKTSSNTEWFELSLKAIGVGTDISIGKPEGLDSTKTSYKVDNLALGTKYVVEIKACNAYGNSAGIPYEDAMNLVETASTLADGKYGYLHLQKVIYHLQDGTLIMPSAGKGFIQMKNSDNDIDGQFTDYYTVRNTGFEFKLPGTTGIPRITKYDTNNRLYDFKGFYASAVPPASGAIAPNEADKKIVIEAGTTDEQAFYAYWTLNKGVSVTFPSYGGGFYVPNSNNPIKCPRGGGGEVVINFAPPAGKTMTDLVVDWKINGYTVNAAAIATDTATNKSTFTVTPNNIKDSHGTEISNGLYQVLIEFSYKIDGVTTEGSTYCYIQIID